MGYFPSVQTATSEAAADSVNPETAKILRERIFELIRASGNDGLTDEEMQRELNIPGNTQRPRRWELSHKQGRIKKYGVRKTSTGRPASVWVVGEPDRPAITSPNRVRVRVEGWGNSRLVRVPPIVESQNGDYVTIEW